MLTGAARQEQPRDTQLAVLINAPRFRDLEEDPQRTLGRAFDAQVWPATDPRRAARSAIARQFGEKRFLTLPALPGIDDDDAFLPGASSGGGGGGTSVLLVELSAAISDEDPTHG